MGVNRLDIGCHELFKHFSANIFIINLGAIEVDYSEILSTICFKKLRII